MEAFMKLKKSLVLFICVGLVLLMTSPTTSSENPKQYDILIKDTKIVDGTGKPAFKGSIAIKGDKVVAVGKVKGDADVVIDGKGLVTCPGFVDPHSHADISILRYPLAENLVMQGITTFVGGNCAWSPAPSHKMSFAEWLTKVEKKGMAVNYVPLVGHNGIRTMVMGQDYRRTATPAEVKRMKGIMREVMESGALGFSVFRDPAPSHFADVDEIVELARVVQEYGGIYAPHTTHIQSQWPTDDPEVVSYGRYLGPPEDVWVGVYRGYLEAIEVGKRANIPVHIAHLSNAYRIPQPHPEFLEEEVTKATLWLIEKSIEDGVDITFDVVASGDSISNARPLISEFYSPRIRGLSWVKDIEKEEFIERLKTREFRDRIRKIHDTFQLKLGMVHTQADPYWFDCFRILQCQNKLYEGKTLGEIARKREDGDALEAIFDILVDDPETLWVQFLDRRGTLAINSVFLAHPLAMPCTDVSSLPASPEGPGLQAPIAYGLYPHYIGNYIRERKIQSLEEAIRKATHFPAQRFGLKGRGVLKPGNFADVVVFDFATINDTGDFLNPTSPPDGMEYVIVNGTIVYKDMAHTKAKPGRVLKKN